MRSIILMGCVAACATPRAAGSLEAPKVESGWPDGWKACSDTEVKEALAAAPPEPDESCGLGHNGCAALRAALSASCTGLSPNRLTVLATTDGAGTVVEHCLAAASADVPADTLACVGQAMKDVGSVNGASREHAPVRIELYPTWVFVADGTGLMPTAVNQTLGAAATELGACKSDGSVVVGWKIAADGSVSDVQVRSKQHEGTPVAACLTAALGKLKFPAHATASDDPYLLRL